jgi:hypothetical protein
MPEGENFGGAGSKGWAESATGPPAPPSSGITVLIVQCIANQIRKI